MSAGESELSRSVSQAVRLPPLDKDLRTGKQKRAGAVTGKEFRVSSYEFRVMG
jgi:hypothetical protein